jgi:hypothetical protein
MCTDQLLRRFAEVWFIDTEFRAPDGERQTPVCLVGYELRTRRTVRCWQNDLWKPPPFETGADRLFVCYYAVAEVSTFIALGWTPPVCILDLFTEFRNVTNGLKLEHGNGLLSALDCYGLPSMSAAEKEAGRHLVMGRTFYTEIERKRIIEYCEADTASLVGLLDRMWADLDLEDALLRGEYMRALAYVEWQSVPLDKPLYEKLSRHWSTLKLALIEQVDPHYHVYAGTRFVTALFEIYLQRQGIVWPRLPDGSPRLDKVTFRDMVKLYPQLNALHELRNTLAKARLSDLRIGTDGRNRCSLSAFRTVTSRNAPRASQYIFGPSRWLRRLIRPPTGYGLAYLDWKAQEIGLGAALASDEAMMADYACGDPYAAFARRQHLMPPDGTEKSHPLVRERCKTLELGLNYGMSDFGLAQRLDIAEIEAADLTDRHRQAYPKFWDYADRVVHTGMQGLDLRSVFGWRPRLGPDTKPKSLRNWPCQSGGTAMLQLAIVAGIEAGIKIVAPVHDAVMILAPLYRLKQDADAMCDLMVRASEVVTGGFPIRVDQELIRWPDRYRDKRGTEMWAYAMRAMQYLEDEPSPDKCQPDVGDDDEDADADSEGLDAFVGRWR